MEHVVTVIVAIMASTGFWEFLKNIINHYKKKKMTPQEIAILALLHDRLYEILLEYNKDAEISADDYDNLIHLYDAYRGLNGNGLIERMFEQLKHKPIV